MIDYPPKTLINKLSFSRRMSGQNQEIPQKYDPKLEEAKVRKLWDDNHVYTFNENTQKPIFSIDTPPPTMSGQMHIGHASSYTQSDVIARYKRMRGFEVFFPFGTDDNGLPTEKLVQKEKKVNLRHVSREEAINICIAYLKETRPQFIQDWKNIGMSCDFNLSYSTIDDHSRRVSQKTFLELYKQGRAKRHESPVIWDTSFQSAIAQAELEDIERKSFFNDIVFRLADGSQLIIGTTRPELLSACVAIFVHPEDKRYTHLIGKTAKSPIYDHEVPILPDEKADPEKGTGAVMCCTFGDTTDIEWYKKHKLPLKMAITPDGKMSEIAGKYAGKPIEDARKEIIKDLKEANLLVAQKEITQVVNVGERSGRPIEIINSKQWYITYLDSREDFLTGSEELKWFPAHMKHRLDNWVKGLNWDWSVSRQRHYGVPIPVWYDAEGNVYLPDESQLPVDPLKDRPHSAPKNIELIPETDVFDTWFTSASTPTIAIELVKNTQTKQKLFPMDLRPQAHDIINFWLFYTMAKSRLLHNQNPWKTATISGWVLDPKGNKMSKSKGNVVSPQEAMDKYSGDAIRFWALGSKLGDDFPYMEKDLQTANKLITKLWNSSKFVALFGKPKKEYARAELEPTDCWALDKLQIAIAESTQSMENFEYGRAKRAIEDYFWNTFCDNYIEAVKYRLYGSDQASKEKAQQTLYEISHTLIRLLAPFVPYITETVYQYFFKKVNGVQSAHLLDWPVAKETDSVLIGAGDAAFEIIAKVRQQKSADQKSLATEIATLTIPHCDERFIGVIAGTVKAKDVVIGSELKVVYVAE
jgi:valyl-tRNA synthetase